MAKKYIDVLAELQQQPGVSTPHGNKSVLKGSFNLNSLRRQYKDAPVLFERWKKDEIRVCWDYDVPVPVKVIFPPSKDSDGYEKNRQAAYQMASGSGGGKGWFLVGRSRNGVPGVTWDCTFGIFEDGEDYGEPVMVETNYLIRDHIKKDDIILAKVVVANATIYGNTVFAGAETPRLKKALEEAEARAAAKAAARAR